MGEAGEASWSGMVLLVVANPLDITDHLFWDMTSGAVQEGLSE